MRYVDIPLLAMIGAALIGFGLCVLALFRIALYLLTLLIEWVHGRRSDPDPKEDDGTDDWRPRPNFYQGIAERAIAGLEEEWRAKQR